MHILANTHTRTHRERERERERERGGAWAYTCARKHSVHTIRPHTGPKHTYAHCNGLCHALNLNLNLKAERFTSQHSSSSSFSYSSTFPVVGFLCMRACFKTFLEFEIPQNAHLFSRWRHFRWETCSEREDCGFLQQSACQVSSQNLGWWWKRYGD